ncbi:group II intron maturase-specific domain-containing protein [Bradyrhizobium sp. INPA03-11B]|uniref:group II intron maturase-specific domain-containing protein n=1 Tax=Bradyrhizobium sp. INPA03-11B TaxID=418598 RepID=UPI00338D61A8
MAISARTACCVGSDQPWRSDGVVLIERRRADHNGNQRCLRQVWTDGCDHELSSHAGRLRTSPCRQTVVRPPQQGHRLDDEVGTASAALDEGGFCFRPFNRTRGTSLEQPIKESKLYLIGWRGYFGFCQTARVLTNLEAWIRRRLCLYLWRQWGTSTTATRSYAVVACQSFVPRLPPVRRRDSCACQDTRRSNSSCATLTSTHSAFPHSMSLPKLNPVEPP